MLLHRGRGLALPFTPPARAIAGTNRSWTDIQDPVATYFNGAVYAAPINMTSGDLEVIRYDENTQATTAFTLHAALDVDDHAAGSVYVRPDGRIVVAYCDHEGTNVLHVRVSTNPEDITAWGTEQDLDPGDGQYSYPMLSADSDGDIWFFYRDNGGSPARLSYLKSTDGGASWSSAVDLHEVNTGIGYWRVLNTGDRIDIMCNDQPPSGGAGQVYHFYVNPATGNRYKSNGTLIASALPIHVSDCTLVQNAADGSHSLAGLGYAGGTLACLFMVDIGGSNNSVRQARYSGGSWAVEEVCQTDGIISGNQFWSGATIDKADAGIVYCARKVGSRFDVPIHEPRRDHVDRRAAHDRLTG